MNAKGFPWIKRHVSLYLKEYTLFHKGNILIFNNVSGLMKTYEDFLVSILYWDFDMKTLMPLYMTFPHISIEIHLS